MKPLYRLILKFICRKLAAQSDHHAKDIGEYYRIMLDAAAGSFKEDSITALVSSTLTWQGIDHSAVKLSVTCWPGGVNAVILPKDEVPMPQAKAIDAIIHAAGCCDRSLTKEFEVVRKQVEEVSIYEFAEDVPTFRQGGDGTPQHELEELVTAERCTELVKLIEKLHKEAAKNAASRIDMRIPGITFGVSNDGGAVYWRDSLRDCLAYRDLQGGDYAVVAVRKAKKPGKKADGQSNQDQEVEGAGA